MNDSVRRGLQAGTTIALVVMLVASLSAIAVVRADNRETEVATGEDDGGGQGAGATGYDGGAEGSTAGPSGSKASGGGGQKGGGSAKAGSGSGGRTAAAGSGDASGAAGGAGSGGGGASTPGQQGAAPPGGKCPGGFNYLPAEGVYCDRWLVGGTTVLSGPLAIYGEQGLSGGQAWLQHFNSEMAPKLGVRKVQLVYYDDGLDPNKTLQFTQRLVEVDKVMAIAGVTSPEAIAEYLDQKRVAMIGDIGLSPKSYRNAMIYPTAPPDEFRAFLATQIAKKDTGAKSIYVIQDILPGVDSTPIRKAWQMATDHYGVELLGYEEVPSDGNDCSSPMLSAIRAQPDYIRLPIAAPPMLACMRTANTQQVRPKAPTSSWLKGWTGGSGLQFEVDQCGDQCDGLVAGTIFLDPTENPHPNAKTYLQNMARYAPGIDVKGFITINYYHAGLLQYEVIKQGGIAKNLSRQAMFEAANHFGPFDTGFGNTVQWTAKVPRVPTTCGYRIFFDADGSRWDYDKKKECVDPNITGVGG